MATAATSRVILPAASSASGPALKPRHASATVVAHGGRISNSPSTVKLSSKNVKTRHIAFRPRRPSTITADATSQQGQPPASIFDDDVIYAPPASNAGVSGGGSGGGGYGGGGVQPLAPLNPNPTIPYTTFSSPSSASSSSSNFDSSSSAPSTNPAYLPDMDKARAWLVGMEARAVEGRDYAGASTAAAAAARIADIQALALLLEIEEMEASLAQEYAAAARAKRRKELLLAEFDDIRFGGGVGGVMEGGAPGSVVDASVPGGGAQKLAHRRAAAAAFVPVRFRVNVKTEFGEHVVVCGSIPELGAWDPAKAPPLEYHRDAWHTTLKLPQGAAFRFKFVVGMKEVAAEGGAGGGEVSLRWQEGNDRLVQLPLDLAHSIDVLVDWEGDSAKEMMWLHVPLPSTPPLV